MNKYVYEGPVLEFGKVVAHNWKGETMAMSESKARCNLKYQFKSKNNRMPGVKIDLPGKITLVS